MLVYTLENRGKRKFVIGTEEHVSGGTLIKGIKGEIMNVVVEPGATVKVNEACFNKLSNGWKGEIRLIGKANRKD